MTRVDELFEAARVLDAEEIGALSARLHLEAVRRVTAAVVEGVSYSRPGVPSAAAPTPSPSRVLRVKPAAKYAGCSTKRLYALANAGRIGHRIGEGPWLFTTTELDELVERDQDDHQQRMSELARPRRGRKPTPLHATG